MNHIEGKVFTSFETGKVPLQVLILQRIESASVQQVGEVSRPLYCRPEYYRKYHRIKKVGCCGLVLQIESFQDETLDSVDSGPDKTLHNMPRAQTRHTCVAELSRGNGQILCFTTTLLPRTAEILANLNNVYCGQYLPTDRTPLTSRMIQSFIPQNIVWCDRLMKHSPYHYYSFRSSLDDVLCKIGCK